MVKTKNIHQTLAIYILVLNIADLTTTYLSIRNGGFEMNPVINAVGNWWIVGAYKLSLPFVMFYAANFIPRNFKSVATVQIFFVIAYVGIIANNIYWI